MTDLPPTEPTAATAPSRVLRVRFSRRGDLQPVLAFYRSLPHQNVAVRDEQVMRDRIDHGHFILVEDAKSGRLVGASGTYPLGAPTDAAAPYVEIGTTRAAINGLGLFQVMVCASALNSFLNAPPGRYIVAEVDPGSPVNDMFQLKAFFQPLPRSMAARLDAAANETKAVKDTHVVNWYRGSADKAPDQAAVLLKLIDSPIVTARDGSRVLFDFSQLTLANEQRRLLEAIASGPLADKLRAGRPVAMAMASKRVQAFFNREKPAPAPAPDAVRKP